MRREKVFILSGCDSRPAAVAPAGSNRSVGGGNELDEASGAKGRLWTICEYAGRNTSERRAGLEIGDAEADLAGYEGRPPLLGNTSDGPSSSAGVCGDGMHAHGDEAQHGKPITVEERELQRDAREGQARPGRVAERLVVPSKPGNAGGGKEPRFKDNAARRRVRRVA